ncbi:uncharacterized domain 1-containing protein [Desulfocicer vacuolatum DSM 3385]|uniref:Uncharacterized domain 1-containing protein n=1 Tax=Desulfocicer vacuolatum DSM 3385 TaxID=1121400 RepID=A0A1W2CJY0_9BACT|nr:PaaI family thioesterase [Desulfocicer vacuolatum]SMC85549.1 uncharacterized domain 1-containing protein [Desulfocicer vacuolatum DSM 3385]
MGKLPDNITTLLNKEAGGFNTMLGLKFTHVTMERLQAELEISGKHHQVYGIVHGGVYAAIAESMCSVGAVINVMGENKNAVGLENSTTFLRAVRSGTLHCVATPLTRGRRAHVWETRIHDDRDRLVASGRVRLMILAPKDSLAGEEIQFENKSALPDI